MGVPQFFAWLSEKFPKAVADVIEQEPVEVNGIEIPIDTSQKNPNGVEYDNLYLDMNGIIHPCTHGDGNESWELTEDQMMENVFKMIDRTFNIVRPRKLLFMAIDGVAPRAKMNQQRARRFRAQKEKEEAIQAKKEEAKEDGTDFDEEKERNKFNSNCITPGTLFMEKVANCLRFYAQMKINTDPGWKNVKVLFSDSNAPGEGEHKIMEYVRKQRSMEGYDPNLRHVICGMDADLIMLGLATHETHFSILRDEVVPPVKRACRKCGRAGHIADECTEEPRKKPYQMLHLATLRQYLTHYLEIERGLQFPWDLNRAIDDWIFLCFFIGNDFLPHMPTLKVRQGALDTLVKLWKETLPISGWITFPDSRINMAALGHLMNALSKIEPQLLQTVNEQGKRNRRDTENRNEQKIHEFVARRMTSKQNNSELVAEELKKRLLGPLFDSENISGRKRGLEDPSPEDPAPKYQMIAQDVRLQPQQTQEDKTRSKHEELLSMGLSKKEIKALKLAELGPEDTVRLGEFGWRERHYEKRFGKEAFADPKFHQNLRKTYLEGLQWVYTYYTKGCPSWGWYFPYHYAPFAIDLLDIADVEIKLEMGTPFTPLQQLMSVLPPGSGQFVPEPYRKLMTDSDSPILSFYPEDFELDNSDGGPSYKWVALLPFIDADLLLNTLKKYDSKLTTSEIDRNSRREHLFFASGSCSVADKMSTVGKEWIEIATNEKDMWGLISQYPKEDYEFGQRLYVPIDSGNYSEVDKNLVYLVQYRFPHVDNFHRGQLEGAIPAPLEITKEIYLQRSDRRGGHYERGQNSAARRMVDGHMQGSQYKDRSFDRDGSHQREEYYQGYQGRGNNDSRGGEHQRGGYNQNSYYNHNSGHYNNNQQNYSSQSHDRGNRGGYNHNLRGGNNNSRGGEHQRGGSHQNQNYHGNEGGNQRNYQENNYPSQPHQERNDHQGNRGGYNNNNQRGGYNNYQRGGYNNNQRGGYNNNNQRGGNNNYRGGSGYNQRGGNPNYGNQPAAAGPFASNPQPSGPGYRGGRGGLPVLSPPPREN